MIDKFSFRIISRKALAGLFSYCTPQGVYNYVPFGGYDLLPTFLSLILRPLLTLIDGG